MKRNIIKKSLFSLLFIISILFSISIVFSENQCETNIDCNDNNFFTKDICIKASQTQQFNTCEHRSFLDGYKCVSDTDCQGIYLTSNKFKIKNSCKFNIDYGFKTCEHKIVQNEGYCEMNLDCDDGNIKTFDKCEYDNLCSHSDLKSFGGKLDDGIYLTDDTDSLNIRSDVANYFERIGHPFEEHDINKDPYKYDFVYKHKYKKLDYNDNALNNIRIINLSKLDRNKSFDVFYNHRIFELNMVNKCRVDIDCDDNNDSTNDKCESEVNWHKFLEGGSNTLPKVCIHTKQDNSCNTDLDCQGRTENPYDLEYCDINNYYGEKTCKSIFDKSPLFKTNREFNLFLDYIPKINFLGHLNNGQEEKFNINTKTYEINNGFDDKAFLLIEMYQNSFEAYQNKYYKEYEENRDKYYRLGFFNKERYLFSKLIYLNFKSDDYYTYSKVTQLNNWTLLFSEIEYNNNLFDSTKNKQVSNKTLNLNKTGSTEPDGFFNFLN